jgi:ribosomal protein S18 acetylase RimI-like enzyme
MTPPAARCATGRTVLLTRVGRAFTSGRFGKMTSPFFLNGCFVPMSLHGGDQQTRLMSCAATTFFRLNQSNATRAYIAHLDGEPIGFIQSYVVMGCGGGWWESETDPGAQGIDQFLAEADQLGRGLGRAMIRAFVRRLFAEPGVTVVQTDPRNERAIRCYAAAGFYPVSPIVTPDGHALLMRCDGPQVG